jgi:hypothetical protein
MQFSIILPFTLRPHKRRLFLSFPNKNVVFIYELLMLCLFNNAFSEISCVALNDSVFSQCWIVRNVGGYVIAYFEAVWAFSYSDFGKAQRPLRLLAYGSAGQTAGVQIARLWHAVYPFLIIPMLATCPTNLILLEYIIILARRVKSNFFFC